MPLDLALLDLVPVVLTALGLRLVARLVGEADPRAGRRAALGAALVVAGGLGKASSKVIAAAGGPDLPVLAALLYPGLALGYVLLAGAVVAAGRDRAGGGLRPWLPAALVLGVLLAVTVAAGPGSGRVVPLAWLVTGGTASLVLDGLLARRAWRAGRRGAAALLLAHLAATLALQALARPDDQTIALQWVQEILNTVTQAAFLAAATVLAAVGRERRAEEVPGHLKIR